MIGLLDAGTSGSVLVDLETETLLEAAVHILGFGLLAAVTAALVAFAFRWYSTEEIPEGVAVLVGISPVAIWLNTQTALQDAIIGTSPLLDSEIAVYTIVAFLASGLAAAGGRRTGDYLAENVLEADTPRTIDDVSQLVRSAGRVRTVELPETIEDAEGYDPVDEATKAELAGQTFLFPRRLSAEQVRERLIDRLERDYGIGRVDVELGEEKTVDYLALGSRPAGIGPTIAPGSVVVAIRADPAPDATPGDAVRVWTRDGEGLRRVTDGELRGAADDVATIAVDADDVPQFTADGDYRLVTLPGAPGAERDLVSLLRAADETVTRIALPADDPLVGETVGSLPAFVLALERATAGEGTRASGGGTVERSPDAVALPDANVRLEAGDVCYVLGRPEALRRLAERREGERPDETATAPP
ncbi:TrkA C-terminal domain-containing protein [Halopiger goleimassiliensis]|uniref:TrkA C-terminal domain-containing protein n=1 Tax=Halopiger goleimassiliensis TaxID=1293048 RepID=UPI000677DC8D|nr:TrkA C-terminal domain-containing protein [Halopiger goleimassiliensis]